MRVNKQFTLNALSSTALAALLATSSINIANAQSSGGNAVSGLEEIIVTARKREESLQDTPVAISAISKESIDNFKIESLEDIATFTPGMLANAQGNSSGGILFMRGIGSGSGSPSIDQAVSLVIDDMQVGSLQMLNASMIDMESIQTYKGPQALFFGKNSPGGVLAIKTADPGDEFEAQLKTGYEVEAEEWFVQGIVSGPMSDTASGRMVVRYTDSEGYFDVNSGNGVSSFDKLPGAESVFARGTLLLEPNEDLTIRTKLTYNKSDGDVGGSSTIQRTNCPFGDPQLILPVPLSQTYACEADQTVEISDIPQAAIDAYSAVGIDIGPGGDLDNEQLQATVAIDYDIRDDLTFTSITGYYDVSDFGPYNPVFGSGLSVLIPVQSIEYEQLTQEFRIASSFDGNVNFVGGVFYEDKSHYVNNPLVGDFAFLAPGFGFPIGSYGLAGSTEYELDSTAYSAFLDVTWDITDKLELSGGARYSYEEKEFNAFAGYIGQAEEDWDDVSPQVTLSYEANDNWMLYASYREGFKSGGFDGGFTFVPAAPRPYEPEEVSGFEFGAKGTLLDDTLQLNAVVYSYDYDELQLSLFESSTLSLVTVNAAAAEIQGIELDFVWLTPVDGLLARGAIAYNDSEFKEYIADCYTGQSFFEGCDDRIVGGVGTGQDVSGQSLINAPEVVINLGLSYEKQFGDLVFGSSLDFVYSDEYQPHSELRAGAEQDSYTKVDLSFRLSDADDTWSLALIGRNLTDEHLLYNGGTAPLSGLGTTTGTAVGISGDTIHYVGVGQTLALEFEYNFR